MVENRILRIVIVPFLPFILVFGFWFLLFFEHKYQCKRYYKRMCWTVLFLSILGGLGFYYMAVMFFVTK